MQLDNQYGPGSLNGLQSSIKDLRFSPFHVNLDQIRPWQFFTLDETIQSDHRSLNLPNLISNCAGNSGQLAPCGALRDPEKARAVRVGESNIFRSDMFEAVNPGVTLELPKVVRKRLKRKYPPSRAGEPRRYQSDKPHISAHVVYYRSWTNQNLQYPLHARLCGAQKKTNVRIPGIEA